MELEEGGQGSTDSLYTALNNLWWILPRFWMLPNPTAGKVSCGHRTSYITSASPVSASRIRSFWSLQGLLAHLPCYFGNSVKNTCNVKVAVLTSCMSSSAMLSTPTKVLDRCPELFSSCKTEAPWLSSVSPQGLWQTPFYFLFLWTWLSRCLTLENLTFLVIAYLAYFTWHNFLKVNLCA